MKRLYEVSNPRVGLMLRLADIMIPLRNFVPGEKTPPAEEADQWPFTISLIRSEAEIGFCTTGRWGKPGTLDEWVFFQEVWKSRPPQ